MPIMLLTKSGHNFFVKAQGPLAKLRDLFSFHLHIIREHEQQHRMKVRKSAIVSREYVPELEYLESMEKQRKAREEQEKAQAEAKKKAEEAAAKRETESRIAADKEAIIKLVPKGRRP